MNLKIKFQWKTILAILALVAGIVLYVGWSAYYNAWTDIGVYSLAALLIAAGILGILLSMPPKAAQ